MRTAAAADRISPAVVILEGFELRTSQIGNKVSFFFSCSSKKMKKQELVSSRNFGPQQQLTPNVCCPKIVIFFHRH
jgi:hypothetical protein